MNTNGIKINAPKNTLSAPKNISNPLIIAVATILTPSIISQIMYGFIVLYLINTKDNKAPKHYCICLADNKRLLIIIIENQ
jgi:hypothetical protein